MEEKKDRRIIRTKKLIVDALISILKEKSVENITVSELAKKADITRATFYQYYKSPVEMLETLQNEITYDVEEIVLETEGGDAYGFVNRLFNYFYNNPQKGKLLSFPINNISGQEKIGNNLHEKYMLRWKDEFQDKSLKQFEYYRYYIIFGCISVLENWVQKGMQETPEEMAETAVSFLPKEKIYLKK